MPKIAAVIILYNPDNSVLDNLNTYVEQVDKLYVIDNSDDVNYSLVERILNFNNSAYINNEKNIGIAAALNIGAKNALEDGYEYMLTMDQDSQAPPLMVQDLFNCFLHDSKTAIVSPLHNPRRFEQRAVKGNFRKVFSVWTSGNLVDLNIFKVTEGFMEKLFIDYVDHEFSLRLNKLGYNIYVNDNILLKHNLGKIEKKRFLFRNVYPTNHPPIRLYYRARNRFYVKQLYKNIFPEFIKQDSKYFWKSFLKVILFEKNRFNKVKYFLRGYLDYRMDRFGKYHRHTKTAVMLVCFIIISLYEIP